MAIDIGPKIGIDGEAEFRKQINNITQQVKTYASEMQVLSTAFDDNTDAEETMTRKSAVLSQEIEAQQKKIELLQRGLSEAAQKFGETDDKTLKWQQAVNRATADLNKMQAELKQNESAMNGLENETDDVSEAMDDAGRSASSFGDVLKGSLAAEAIGGALGTIKDAVKELGQQLADYSLQSENATVKATAYFGETGDAARQTEQVIKDVFAGGVGESMDEVANAVIAVKSNLDDLSQTDLTNLTNQAITLESMYGIDMNETLRGVNSLMQQFGLSAQEAMDFIVAGTQNGLDKTQELGDNLSEYAGKFAQAGYSAEEYFQLLNNGLDNGAYNLDKVNDAINEVTTRLADGTIADEIDSYSIKTRELFKSCQDGEATQKDVIDSIVWDIANVATQQDALTLAATAFGTMAEDGNLKFITSLTSVGDAYSDVTGKAQELTDATTTSQQELDAALRGAQEQLAPIGDKLVEIATAVIPQASQAFSDFAGFVSQNGPAILSVIAGIGAALGAWNVVTMIQGLVGSINAFKAANEGATIAQYAINAAMNANPIGLLITAITAIVTAIGVFIATNEDARNKISEVWETIKSTVSSAIDTVKQILESIIQFIQNNWQALLLMLVNPFAGAFKLLYDNCEQFRQTVDQMVENVKNAFQNLYQNVTTKAREIGTTIINGIKSAVDYIASLPGQFLNWGRDMIDNLINGIKEGIGKVGDAIGSVADTIRSYIHFSKPDKGPLADFDTYMPDMTKMITSGIRAGIPEIEKAMKEEAAAMRPNLQEANGTAIAYNRLAEKLGNLQVVLNDGTLVGKLTPRINRTLGGYARKEGRFGV